MKRLLKLYINYLISELTKKIIIELIENDNPVHVAHIHDTTLFDLNSLFHEKVFLHEIFRNIKINPVLQLIFLRCKFNIVSKNSINLCYIHLLLYVTDNARLCMTFKKKKDDQER